MSRRYDYRRLDLAVAYSQLDDVVFLQAKLRESRTRDYCRVIPAQARYRLGQLLQPAHIRPAPVIHIRIWPENNLDGIFRRRHGHFGDRARFRGSTGHVRAVRNPAIMQSLAPTRLKVSYEVRILSRPHGLIRTQKRLIV